jgi:glucose/arabinose dehydrogenase
MAQKRAGAATPSANRITLLRDADADGVAETRTAFLQGLNSPFGMTLIGQDFYVANTDSILRYTYTDGATEITAPGIKIADLPAGPLNHHWTKSLVASPDGSRLMAEMTAHRFRHRWQTFPDQTVIRAFDKLYAAKTYV